ncbi:GIY-YIG nuclease family protein [Lysobacter sp. yr284]|uniref:GIY-YIG nuclease family protein n=1 Tax=Lysobacter sp. yr284 TaxID=1761791 RepID=UPI000B890630|nr:GIY-YIG nuclease family protein [Lysobacter sp. yr284]
MGISFLEYASAMIGCYAALPCDERERLHAWESDHLGGPENYGTSDWPGWEKYIRKYQPPHPAPKDTFGYVYLIQSTTGYCKIGSSRSVQNRLRQLQCANPEPLTLLQQFASAKAQQDELSLHAQFADRRVRNEWFALTVEDVAHISAFMIQAGV